MPKLYASLLAATFATALAYGADAASNQTYLVAQATVPSVPSRAVDNSATAPGKADATKLIGRNIHNRQDETVGEIKSVHLNREGRVSDVIVGIGGFLGIGEKEVALAWQDLQIADNGEKVTINMTKDQLKAMPEYHYTNPTYRGGVFSD